MGDPLLTGPAAPFTELRARCRPAIRSARSSMAPQQARIGSRTASSNTPIQIGLQRKLNECRAGRSTSVADGGGESGVAAAGASFGDGGSGAPTGGVAGVLDSGGAEDGEGAGAGPEEADADSDISGSIDSDAAAEPASAASLASLVLSESSAASAAVVTAIDSIFSRRTTWSANMISSPPASELRSETSLPSTSVRLTWLLLIRTSVSPSQTRSACKREIFRLASWISQPRLRPRVVVPRPTSKTHPA